MKTFSGKKWVRWSKRWKLVVWYCLEIFKPIFQVILWVKIKLLRTVLRPMTNEWHISKIRFRVLEDHCNRFWSCQIFIYFFIFLPNLKNYLLSSITTKINQNFENSFWLRSHFIFWSANNLFKIQLYSNLGKRVLRG